MQLLIINYPHPINYFPLRLSSFNSPSFFRPRKPSLFPCDPSLHPDLYFERFQSAESRHWSFLDFISDITGRTWRISRLVLLYKLGLYNVSVFSLLGKFWPRLTQFVSRSCRDWTDGTEDLISLFQFQKCHSQQKKWVDFKIIQVSVLNIILNVKEIFWKNNLKKFSNLSLYQGEIN